MNEIFLNRGATPYLFESSCALIMGAKLLASLLQRVYTKEAFFTGAASQSLFLFRGEWIELAGGAIGTGNRDCAPWSRRQQ